MIKKEYAVVIIVGWTEPAEKDKAEEEIIKWVEEETSKWKIKKMDIKKSEKNKKIVAMAVFE